MLRKLKLNVLFRLLESKYFLFINLLFLTLIIGISKFFNFSINYFLLYLFFFNLFFLKFQKNFLLKNIFILLLLIIEILYFFFLNKFDVSQFLVFLFFNFFIISIVIKEVPIHYINGLKIGIYSIFILDIVIMLIKITTGEFLGHFGQIEIFYKYEYWPELRANGLLQSPILSCILSISVFLFSFYFKDKLFIFLSILFCNLSGSSRAFIFILLFLIIYFIFLFFFAKDKIYLKKNVIAIIVLFLFSIMVFFVSINSFKTSSIIRFLMFKEFVKCYLSIEICTKDSDKEKKIGKDIIKITNKINYNTVQNIKKYNPDFAKLLADDIKRNKLGISKIVNLIMEQEYLSIEEKDILIYQLTLSNDLLNSYEKIFNSLNNEKIIMNRVKDLSNAKIYENHYLSSIINYGFISITFRLFFLLYLFFLSLKKFMTYQHKNIFSFTLIISIFLSSFLDTIIYSYFFVIYVWTFLFFIIQQKENFEQKIILK